MFEKISVLMYLVFITMVLLGIISCFYNFCNLTESQIFAFICGGGISYGLYLIAWIIGQGIQSWKIENIQRRGVNK